MKNANNLEAFQPANLEQEMLLDQEIEQKALTQSMSKLGIPAC